MPARKWPKRRNPVLHKINRTAERQRRDDISLGQGGSAGNPISGGGGGTVEWHPLSDIFTPATGIYIHASTRYAWDSNFLYLEGPVDVGDIVGPAPDDSTHPAYFLGDIVIQGFISSPPAPEDPDSTNWSTAVALPGGPNVGPPVGLLQVSMPGISLGSPVTGGAVVIIDPAAAHVTGPGAGNFSLSLDGVALPWDHA